MRRWLASLPFAFLFGACASFGDGAGTPADAGATGADTGSDARMDDSPDADADAGADADTGADAMSCACPLGSKCQGAVCMVASDPTCGTPIAVASTGTVFDGTICGAPAVNVCATFEMPAHVFRNETLSSVTVTVESKSNLELAVGQSTQDCPKSTGDSCRLSSMTQTVSLSPGDVLVVGRIDTTAGLCAPYRVTFATH